MRRAVLLTVLLTVFLATCVDVVPAPLEFMLPEMAHTFWCNCALRVLNHPLFVTYVHLSWFRKKGVLQGSDGEQISLICLPALHADGGADHSDLPVD